MISEAENTALRVAEEELRLPNRISRFVLTVGATANQNGTALFEGVTVLFLAQFFGVAGRAVLPQKDPLPGAQQQAPVAHRDRQAGP